MTIQFNCKCGQAFAVPDSLAGKKARCNKCQAVVDVPCQAAGEDFQLTPLGGAAPSGGNTSLTPLGPTGLSAKPLARAGQGGLASALDPADPFASEALPARKGRRSKSVDWSNPVTLSIIGGGGLALILLLGIIWVAFRSPVVPGPIAQAGQGPAPATPVVPAAVPPGTILPVAPAAVPPPAIPPTAIPPTVPPTTPPAVPPSTGATVPPPGITLPPGVNPPPGVTLPPATPAVPPAVPGPGAGPAPAVGAPAGPPAVAPAADPRPTKPAGKLPPAFTTTAPKFGSKAPPPPAEWKGQPDPPAEPFTLDATKKLSIPIPSFETFGEVKIVTPAMHSPFVAIGSNRELRDNREVWNLVRGAKKGAIAGLSLWNPSAETLSADGEQFALIERSMVGVWAVRGSKLLLQFPSRDIKGMAFVGPGKLATWGSERISVIQIPKGNALKEFFYTADTFNNHFAISPGGRYIAVSASGFVQIYDWAAGEVVGQIRFPNGADSKAQGLAFSPDGAELAVISSDTFLSFVALVVCDMKDGKVTVAHELQGFAGPRGFREPTLSWLPDKSGWLANGSMIIDRTVGGPVWGEEPANQRGWKDFPLRIPLDRTHAVGLVLGAKPALATIDFPAAEIENGVKAFAASAPTKRQPLTAAALNQADELNLDAKPPAWSVKPDSAPAATRPLQAEVRLERTLDPEKIATSRSDTGMAVVSYLAGGSAGKKRAAGTPVWMRRGRVDDNKLSLDVYDLVAGKKTATINLGASGWLLGISPSGKMLAAGSGDEDGRVDVFTATGEHVAGFRPFAELKTDETFEVPEAVVAAVFVDDTHLFTTNEQGQLVLWELPECKPVYRHAKAGVPILSPGGKYMAYHNDKTVRFFEVLTGKAVGLINDAFPRFGNKLNESPTVAFDITGSRVAMIGYDGADYLCATWNLSTGVREQMFAIPQNGAPQWCVHHLLLDQTWLLDMQQKKVGWRYKLPPAAAVGADGRVVYVASGVLRQVIVPEQAVVDRLAGTQIPDESVLKTGMRVSIQVNVGVTSKSYPNPQEGITARLREQLAARGVQVDADAPLTMTVTTNLESTGQQLSYRNFFGGGEVQQVGETNLQAVVALMSNGQTLWQRKMTFWNGGSVRLQQGEDLNSHLVERQASSCLGSLLNFTLPQLMYPPEGGRGLGETELTK